MQLRREDDKDEGEYFVLLGAGVYLLLGISEQGIIVKACKRERAARTRFL
jgi:hypothetical protein